VSARLPQGLIDQIEQWSVASAVSRSEAIRRLVELGLTVRTKGIPPKIEDAKPGTKQRASEIAGDAIDSMADLMASVEDQVSRKRRLIKGPEEFQKARRDRDRK